MNGMDWGGGGVFGKIGGLKEWLDVEDVDGLDRMGVFRVDRG